jgi:serine/threonine protein kinase
MTLRPVTHDSAVKLVIPPPEPKEDKKSEILFEHIEQVSCQHCGAIVPVANARPLSYIPCPECPGKVFVPVRLANFLFQGPVGEGEMGSIYRATDEIIGREVAIKLLRGSYAGDPESCERLRKEACALGKLNHSRVAQVYSLNFSNGHPYLVMELVTGEDFEKKLLQEGHLDERVVLRMAGDVAEGLAALNREGLVHSDIKPGNIVMDRDGNSKLVDFGLTGMSRYDSNHKLMGTPDYIAPELIRGGKDTPCSDMFSLGATLYHLLSGRPPTMGESPAEVVRARLEKVPIPPLHDIAPHVSKATSRMVMKMLEYEPEARLQNSDILAYEVKEAVKQLDAAAHDPDAFSSGTASIPAPSTQAQAPVQETTEAKVVESSGVVSSNYFGDPVAPADAQKTAKKAEGPKRPLKIGRLIFLLIVLTVSGLAVLVQFPPCDGIWASFCSQVGREVDELAARNEGVDKALKWSKAKMGVYRKLVNDQLGVSTTQAKELLPPLGAFVVEEKPAWMITNVGDQPKRGSTVQRDGALMIQLPGVEVGQRVTWKGGYDHSRYIWAKVATDTYAFSGRMLATANQNPQDVTGVQVKETDASTGPWIFFGMSGDGELFLQIRGLDKKTTIVRSEKTTLQQPYLMMIRRVGDFEALHSSDGKTWKSFGRCSLKLPANHVVGFAISTVSPDATTTVKFDSMKLTVPKKDGG